MFKALAFFILRNLTICQTAKGDRLKTPTNQILMQLFYTFEEKVHKELFFL